MWSAKLGVAEEDKRRIAFNGLLISLLPLVWGFVFFGLWMQTASLQFKVDGGSAHK